MKKSTSKKPTYINTVFRMLTDIGIKKSLVDSISGLIEVDQLI